MSQSQQQADELAQLFTRNMIFTQPLPQSTPDKQFIFQESSVHPPIIYSSQHYTGTYHLSRPRSEPAAAHQSRAHSPFSIAVEDVENTLRRNDIDPASLTRSQANLFANADYEQRLRLLELWRISPPEKNTPTQLYHEQVWPITSLAQEEELARQRYERRMNERDGAHHSSSSSLHHTTTSEAQEAEPYVISGYANASQRIDPVYAAAAGAWQAPNYAQALQDMELQYGAFQQAQQMGYMQAQNDDMVM